MTGCLLILWATAEVAGLPAADVPRYARALTTVPAATAQPVTFRDLWDRADAHRGRAVRVEGRVARQFAAPASGALPARVEAWLATDSGDLICVVFPSGPTAYAPPEGLVAMEGTSLGRIEYASGDGPRLAPLIVGPTRPVPAEPPRPAPGPDDALGGWIVAGLGVAMAAVALARLRGRKPPTRRDDAGPPLEFLS